MKIPRMIFKTPTEKFCPESYKDVLSSKIGRMALRENSFLKQVLDQARVIELAHVRATEMEQKEIHAVSYNRNENDKRHTRRNNNRSTVKVLVTPVTAIPYTSNMTAAELPRSPKRVEDTVIIVDTLQHTLPVQLEIRSVEAAIRRTILLEYVSW